MRNNQALPHQSFANRSQLVKFIEYKLGRFNKMGHKDNAMMAAFRKAASK